MLNCVITKSDTTIKPTIYDTEEQHKQLVYDLSVANAMIERLQEQLNEANDVIKKYRRFEVALKVEKGVLTGVYPAVDYLKKWGVK